MGEVPVGIAHAIFVKDPDFKAVIAAPTMRVPMDISTTVNAYLAFKSALVETSGYGF